MRKLLAAIVVCVALAGCDGVSPFLFVSPIVNGYIMWKDGEGIKYYHNEPYELYHGLKVVLHKLDHRLVEDQVQSDGGFYILSQSQNHRFKIRVVSADKHVGAVKIRIDFMGDRPYAEMVFRELDEQIGGPPVPR